MFDKFRIKITILASLIITVFCFFKDIDFLRTCYSIITTIIIFYFVGSFIEFKIKSYLEKNLISNENNIEDLAEDSIQNLTENEENFSNDFYEENIQDNYNKSLEDEEFYSVNFDE